MSVVVYFLLFFSPLVVVSGNDDCIPMTCRKDGPVIRFPFRHKDNQPQHCGYPGFDVECDDKNDTVLVLPFSVNVVVKKINYVSQRVLVYHQEDCLAQKLPHLNLSASPFHLLGYHLADYVLFNCSGRTRTSSFGILVACPSESSYEIYAVESNFSMESLPLTSCTKTYEIPSVTWDIFLKNDFYLEWSKPECSVCEDHGKLCSLFNYTTLDRIQCLDKLPTTNHHGSRKKQLVAGFGSVLVVITLAALVYLYIRIRIFLENRTMVGKFLRDYRALKPTRFSYSDITRITRQFSEKLGEGGYGIVYKGKLNKIDVAVKVLNDSKGNGEEFVNEVSTIGRIHHVNVVRLVGFCADGFRRALVYEFLPNDSLEKFIFQAGSKRGIDLGWEKLKDIALGIAKGIEYLHEGCDQQILHFDIKPQNVLLDHNLNPKICDFGLAKLCSKEQSAVTMTVARGTMGYIAPEVLSRTFGRVSYKSDVYSFGMLLLEIVGGRKNVDPNLDNTSQVYFPQWIYNHLNAGENHLWTQIDERGGDDGNTTARKLSIVGLWCIQWCPTDRPSMKAVVQMLEGDNHDLAMPPNPFPATTYVPESCYKAELPIISELD